VNILVTGGAGFIGSHVCKILAQSGYNPITYDNLSRGHRQAVKFGPFEHGDTADTTRLLSIMHRYRPNAIMHFAAFSDVAESTRLPLLYYCNNISGTISVLKAAQAFSSLPFIFSSTCAIYCIPECTPIAEDHPQRPINGYGFSKIAIERALADLGTAFPWISLRYFNAAGADPQGELGEQHEPETHLIPSVLNSARSGTIVTIYGNDYDTPDGTCVRDYVHVMDIAEAHVRALEHLLKGGPSGAFNLGNTKGYSVREVVALCEQVCGRKIPTVIGPRRSGDPPVLIGSAKKARNLLGWIPQRSDLVTQIQDAWNWICSASRR
jgi:UDP-glucose-4-epimerase GalE